jgi:hypothetical protein
MGEMAVDDAREYVGEISLRVDAAELARLDQRGDDSPIFSATIRAGKESVLAIEGNRGVILPVSDRK